MVMQSEQRVLTVEEAKRVPPPSSAELVAREQALQDMLAIREEAIRGLGRLLTDEEVISFYRHDDEDDDPPFLPDDPTVSEA